MQSTVQLCLSLCTFLLTNISNKFLTNGGLCVLLVKSSWIFFFFFVKTWLLSFKKLFFSSFWLWPVYKHFKNILLYICQTAWFECFAYAMYLTPNIWLRHAHLLVLSHPSLDEWIFGFCTNPLSFVKLLANRAGSIVWGLRRG